MNRNRLMQKISTPILALAAVAFIAAPVMASHEHTTSTFSGAKVNAGTVTHSKQGNADVLTLSDDFKVPDTPAPHWQVVDSSGNTYLLQRLVVKGDKLNKSITLPAYIHDVAKVQIWCAYAEVLLGEASFPSPVK
jgi:hypothetical protein